MDIKMHEVGTIMMVLAINLFLIFITSPRDKREKKGFMWFWLGVFCLPMIPTYILHQVKIPTDFPTVVAFFSAMLPLVWIVLKALLGLILVWLLWFAVNNVRDDEDLSHDMKSVRILCSIFFFGTGASYLLEPFFYLVKTAVVGG